MQLTAKEEKRIYDIEYRKRNKERIRIRKTQAYLANSVVIKEKERIRRSKPENKERHLEYCRQPEYRADKKIKDRIRLAKKEHGEYWESAILIYKIKKNFCRLVPHRWDRYKMTGKAENIITKQGILRKLKRLYDH